MRERLFCSAMQNPSLLSDPITLVISEVVDPNKIPQYEAWTKGINQAAQQFEGFLGVEVIRPRDHAYPEYVVIVKFDNYAHCRTWLASATYQAWMARSQEFIADRSQQHLPGGLEVWFSLPRTSVQASTPPYYKKVILGVLAVYPLILLANWLLNPLLQGLPPLMGLFISVIFVSALLTYPVMPWLTRLLQFWLYPTQRQSAKRFHRNREE